MSLYFKNEQFIAVDMNKVSFETVVEELKVSVTYFVLPNEDFAALVRKIVITNLKGDDRDLEILDEMPAIIPFGIENKIYREISNTLILFIKPEVYGRSTLENSSIPSEQILENNIVVEIIAVLS